MVFASRLTPLWITMALLTALAIVFHSPGATAHAQPEITESDPREGEVLSEPPAVIHLCFSEPVDIRNRDAFSFRLRAPDGLGLGFRAEFLGRGECVDIHPGGAAGEVVGVWTLDWQVTSLASGQQRSGRLQFSVAGEGSPAPSRTPAPTPDGGTPEPDTTPTQAATPTPAATPIPVSTGGAAESGGGPDILLVALITTGAMMGAAVLGLVAYVIRLRVGFWLHRPPASEDGEASEQH
jgi:methionine-rich copper-binding protein CopC